MLSALYVYEFFVMCKSICLFGTIPQFGSLEYAVEKEITMNGCNFVFTKPIFPYQYTILSKAYVQNECLFIIRIG